MVWMVNNEFQAIEIYGCVNFIVISIGVTNKEKNSFIFNCITLYYMAIVNARIELGKQFYFSCLVWQIHLL